VGSTALAQTTLLLALVVYTGIAVHVLLRSLARKRELASGAHVAVLVGFVLHTLSLGQRWAIAGHFPAVGLRDIAAFLSWTIVLVFLLVFIATRVQALSIAAFPVAFVLALVAILAPASDRSDPILSSFFLPVHTTFAFFGYGSLFVAFAMGVLYLIEERELRARAPRIFYYLVPSLERCDTIGGRSAVFGLTFLTLAIVTGMLWSHSARGVYFTGSAKEWSALAAWLIYLALVTARHRSGWGGRRAALLGIAGFAAMLLVFLWVMLQVRGGPAA
jgi:ABC-type transport system involved in cytochrome c biogenesis permease subunit